MKPKHDKPDYGIAKGILKWMRYCCRSRKTTNNWRKMHGKPMHRKIYNPKLKKVPNET